jgi:predicted nucleotidyltransferase
MSGDDGQAFSDIEAALKKTCATLREAQVPFLLGGSLASWARGGPETRHDLDLMIKEEDVDRALDALEQVGMRPERPPEEWLVKAWDGDVLVDLIHHPCGLPIDEEVLARGEVMSVLSMEVPVMALEDVLVTKLNALTEHSLRYEGLLSIARALRERIDWDQVRRRARDTPFARAFFVLLDGLGIVSVPERPATGGAARRGVDVRVVGGTHG